MDAIQKTLIRAGRRDLAQKYYQKVTGLFKEDLGKDVYKLLKKHKVPIERFKTTKSLKTMLQKIGGALKDYKEKIKIVENHIDYTKKYEKIASKIFSLGMSDIDWGEPEDALEVLKKQENLAKNSKAILKSLESK